MKKQLVLVASSVAILMAASSALAARVGSNPVNVNASSGRTGETMTSSNPSILIPSQTTQEFQLNLNQNSRPIFISQSNRFIGCGTLIDPKPPTNVRSGPGTNFKVIGGLDKGASVSLVQKKNGWVRVTSDSGIDGWVSQKLVRTVRCP